MNFPGRFFVDEEKKVERVEPAKVVSVEAEDIEPVVEAKEGASEETTDVASVKTEEVLASEIENKIENLEDEVEMNGPTMHYLAGTIYFENGGAVIGSNYRNLLRKIAKLAKENDATVTIYGFASSRTRDTDPASHKLANFKVSAERAENTVKALINAGVKSEKITSQAMSDSMPMYQEVMPEGERLNRRAEIYLTY
jgi:outer membrane protein OmpA-like peptidoglycan-associated protein